MKEDDFDKTFIAITNGRRDIMEFWDFMAYEFSSRQVALVKPE